MRSDGQRIYCSGFKRKAFNWGTAEREGSKVEKEKKTLFSELQAIVNDLLSGISQEMQIKILISLVLICIKAIQYERQSFIPGTASNTESILYGEIARLKDEFTKHKS